MKALFKRNSPPPPAPTPTSPFPTFDTIREGAVPSLHSLRNRGFSFTKDAFTSPVKVVSAPIAHQTPSSPKTYMTNRKRLQSGGITFDEVLPTSATPAVPLPPQPLLKAVPPILRPVLYSTCPRPGLTAPAITHSQPASTSERAGVPDVIAAPTCYPSSTGYARPHSNRPRRVSFFD